MDWLKLWEYVTKQWEKKTTLLLVIIVVVIMSVVLLPLIDFTKLQIWQLLVVVSIVLTVLILWLYSTRCPKCEKNKNGILIAINPEHENDEICIKNDFISRMKSEALNDQNIKIITLPSRFSRKIVDYQQAVAFCTKCKAKMIIWGDVKKREINGKDHRVLRLHSMLLHMPIPHELSRHLGQSMSETMPLNLNIQPENEFSTIEITARRMQWTVKYFIASIMLFEKDIIHAEQYMIDLWENREIKQSDIPQLKKLHMMIRSSLINIYYIKSMLAYSEWRINKSPKSVVQMGDSLTSMEKVGPLQYGARLLKAACLFLNGRHTDLAIKEIKLCTGIPHVEWKYSLAFLYAYKGNLNYAQKFYKQAFSGNIMPEQVLDIEIFIRNILEEEPEKKQLYFCLGLISYHIKMDYISAQDCFNKFITSMSDNSKYQKQINFSNNILKAIQDELEKQT